ncbi:alkaline serine protease, subtilase family protein [hydrothermal vent metagenome]|uniref:Alkaline serine protease, subtilase family protein n=1 Tax=hydrothermal vent metagenome TaxID=652676 RepID=A0A1W1EHD2_9ZZZZ
MNRIKLIKMSLLSSILILSSCGGGGSSNSSIELNNTQENLSDNSTIDDTIRNEPYFKYQWHLNSSHSILNDKGYRVDDNADINILEAWKVTKGAGVRVAVIDDGGQPLHEDLKDNVILTYNVNNGSNTVYYQSYHGSHGNTCSGFIASPINGVGTIGVAPESKLIIIRQNEISDAQDILAFEYAKNNGAKVISCSWGSYNVSDILVSELKKMYDAGITVIFASGNDGSSLDSDNVNDESEVKWVIGVGASTENNDFAYYSNYGKNIDVIAPGGDTDISSGILGIDNMGEDGESSQLNLVNNNYAFTNGTSFATPVTAGVIALMYSVNPNITPKEVRDILIKTADKVGTNNGANYNSNGFDIRRAYGKINAGKAVLEAQRVAN